MNRNAIVLAAALGSGALTSAAADPAHARLYPTRAALDRQLF